MFRMKHALLIVVALSVAGAAHAHTGAEGVVKKRMVVMSTVGKAMKALAEMFRGKVDYDADRVRQQARIIRDHGGDTMLKLFPENSLMAPTEARPEIWSDWETFSGLAHRLVVQAGALDQAAASAGAPQVAFRDLARTCSACHKSFRTKK